MTKSKRGRPTIPIDWTQFDSLCSIQCTQAEIASFFSCSTDTIDRACKREKKMYFAEYFEQKSKAGYISLRRKMFKLATEKDNVTMLIWLAKNHLGMADKIDEKTHIKSEEKQIIEVQWADEGELVLAPVNKDVVN